MGWTGRDGRKLDGWQGVKQLYILTFKTHHTAAILLKFPVQHVDGSVIRRIVVARIVDHHIVAIVVQHEGTLLVAGQYPLLQIAALDSRGDVYLASGESTQHYAGNAKVDRRTDVTIGELIRATTIEDDKILVRFPQLTVQLLARDDLYIVVRHLAPNRNSAITAMHPKSGHFSSPKSLRHSRGLLGSRRRRHLLRHKHGIVSFAPQNPFQLVTHNNNLLFISKKTLTHTHNKPTTQYALAAI